MRGFTHAERAALMADRETPVSKAIGEPLVTRGLFRDDPEDPSYIVLTDLGRLALRVCPVEGT